MVLELVTHLQEVSGIHVAATNKWDWITNTPDLLKNASPRQKKMELPGVRVFDLQKTYQIWF
ncbi:hypothetical protein DPMN_115136 [Dreissena polymorpha]|uniref:Uncharacterized protein n=1 Tax=Dreissena polymorpha TaxID=45954 RepID=A0A9D4QSN2_DREPO|nr:hypothetical protein DPMN_115136 [Dreissena polymorpha]